MHDTPRWPITVPTASFVWAKDWTGSQDGKGNLAALCLGWAHPIPATLSSTNSGQRAQGHRHKTGHPGGVHSDREGGHSVAGQSGVPLRVL